MRVNKHYTAKHIKDVIIFLKKIIYVVTICTITTVRTRLCLRKTMNKTDVIYIPSLLSERLKMPVYITLVKSGFGAYGNSRGRAVFTKNIYHGYESRCNREDIMGVIREDCIPDWVTEKLQQMNTPTDSHTDEPDM